MSEIQTEQHSSSFIYEQPSEMIEISSFKQNNAYELTLFYKENCPFCQKVFTQKEKISPIISLKNIYIDLKAREKLLSFRGKIQVPCLFIDNQPLYEPEAIISWLQNQSATF